MLEELADSQREKKKLEKRSLSRSQCLFADSTN